jgi:hypothetical protein
MTTITLPPDIETPLVRQARALGTTPEELALGTLRTLFRGQTALREPAEGDSLFDFLSGYAGVVNGTSEALSEDCGERFAEGLLEKSERGRP